MRVLNSYEQELVNGAGNADIFKTVGSACGFIIEKSMAMLNYKLDIDIKESITNLFYGLGLLTENKIAEGFEFINSSALIISTAINNRRENSTV